MPVITLKFRKIKGVLQRTMIENIASDVNKNLRMRYLNNLIGEKHPFQKDEIIGWIEKSCFKRKYFNESDKEHHDYQLFMERLYKTVMTKYVRNSKLIKIKGFDEHESPYYFPGLIYIMGQGWIIADNKKIIDAYDEQRRKNINAIKKATKRTVLDANDFVNRLGEHKQERLEME